MAIQLFEPLFHVEECLEEIRECLEKGWTGMGYKTAELEERWKKYMGIPYALFLNSCTAALNLSLDVMKTLYGWGSDAEIITTPNTFVSTNHAILQNGLIPIFADVDHTLCISPDEAERKITDRTKAILYVGIGGNSGHYDRILQLCEKYGIKLILDAAHMAGTRFKGKNIGAEADAVCYSFHAVKNLPTGDSGMLCVKNAELDAMARKKAWLGISKDTFQRSRGLDGYQWQYDVEYVGNKYNGNSIMAAVALAQLPYLEEGNVRRRQIADLYRFRFATYADRIRLPEVPKACESSCHLFQILVNDRDEMINYLRKNGINPGMHYLNNTRYPMYSDQMGTCPLAEYAADHLISLPIHLRLTDEQVMYVADKVIAFVEGVR